MSGTSRRVGQWALAAMLGAACGCAATVTPEERAANAQRIEREAHFAQVHDDNQWFQRLAPESEKVVYGPFEVDGRRLRLEAINLKPEVRVIDGKTYHNPVYYGDGHISEGAYPMALLDADTGEPILKRDFWDIVVVPGEAVYVREPITRLFPNRTGGVHWTQVDVKTGALAPSGLKWAMTLPLPEQRGSSFPPADPTAQPALLQRGDPSEPSKRLSVLEVVPPPGSPITRTTYDRAKVDLAAFYDHSVGRFLRFNRVPDEGDGTTVLLDADGGICMETALRVQTFQGHDMPTYDVANQIRYLATPAPASDPADDLWLLLGDNGEFGAPPGVLGYRPVYRTWTVEHGTFGKYDRWLMRLACKGDQIKWHALGPDFKPLPGRRSYTDVVIFEAPWFFGAPDKYTTADVRSTEFTAIRLFGDRWELYLYMDVPDLDSARRSVIVSGDSLETLMERLAIQVANNQAVEIKRLRDQLEKDWRAALASHKWSDATSMATRRGGNSYYELCKAMPAPSESIINRALDHTTDASMRAELQKMAELAHERYLAAVAEQQAREKQFRLAQLEQFEAGRRAEAARKWEPSGASSWRPSEPYVGSSTPTKGQMHQVPVGSTYAEHRAFRQWTNPYGF